MADPAHPKPAAIDALTSRMRRGEESAYREFYDLYFDRLLRYLLVLTRGSEEAAREALQLTLLRVARYIKPIFYISGSRVGANTLISLAF